MRVKTVKVIQLTVAPPCEMENGAECINFNRCKQEKEACKDFINYMYGTKLKLKLGLTGKELYNKFVEVG